MNPKILTKPSMVLLGIFCALGCLVLVPILASKTNSKPKCDAEYQRGLKEGLNQGYRLRMAEEMLLNNNQTKKL